MEQGHTCAVLQEISVKDVSTKTDVYVRLRRDVLSCLFILR
jgi:hypothetical protein